MGCAAEPDPEPDAWGWFDSDIDGREALRPSFRVAGGEGGFSPECDFWTRKLPGLAVRKVIEEGEATA